MIELTNRRGMPISVVPSAILAVEDDFLAGCWGGPDVATNTKIHLSDGSYIRVGDTRESVVAQLSGPDDPE